MKLQLASHNVFRPQDHNISKLATRSLSGLPTLVQRSAESSASETGTTTPAQEQNNDNLIIGLVVAIPLAAAIVVLFFLHRRVKRKQRLEDANDKHKSLDFGMGDVAPSKGRQPKVPEMTVTDMESGTRDTLKPGGPHKHGLSLDMNTPYLLSADAQHSRESFQTLRYPDDPYSPVTMMSRTETNASSRSPSRARRNDNDSVYTSSSIPPSDSMGSSLLKNAQRMSQSDPFASPADAYASPDPFASPDSSPDSEHAPEFKLPPKSNKRQSLATRPSEPPVVEITEDHEPYRPKPTELQQPTIPTFSVSEHDTPAPKQSHPAAAAKKLAISVTPEIAEPEPEPAPAPAPKANRLSNRMSVTGNSRRVSMMGLRAQPAEDPHEDPEQRAMRIRSFYKEYFDESKPNPAGIYEQYNPYDGEFEPEYFEDGALYDPSTGDFIPTRPAPPFAQGQGMPRRAMTPDGMQTNPRFRPRSNTASLQSTGHMNNPAFRGQRPPQPKKNLPPPAPLTSLPTPSKLAGNDMDFLNSLDFAPPITHRDTQLGRAPDSPMGVRRPYSPAVAMHSPLVQSFDDLAALPTPHALRKSGTFTSLDFAPPPRFRNADGGNGSDAGSIRSNRSGISQMHNNALRAGAYRVSRLPQDMVGTKDDLDIALKPSWNLRGVNPTGV